jgi:hypothetical protein
LRVGNGSGSLLCGRAAVGPPYGPSSCRPGPGVVPAYAASASALVAVLTAMVAQTEVLARQVEQGFGRHPDAEIYRSQPGLGTILGARVLAEFGDDPNRCVDAKARKNYSGMSPITRASSTKRVVLARPVHPRIVNHRGVSIP